MADQRGNDVDAFDVRVHDALVVCECGVQGSFSGDVCRLQHRVCYRCQAIGHFVGTILQGYFANLVFWDHRDRMAFAGFELLYRVRWESLRQSRIDRAADFGETICDGEADVRSRLLMMNAFSSVIAQSMASHGGTAETTELSRDLSCAAKLLAKAMAHVIQQKELQRLLDLHDVLFEADAVKWLDRADQPLWRTGTLIERRKPLATVIDGEMTCARIVLPFMSVERSDSEV